MRRIAACIGLLLSLAMPAVAQPSPAAPAAVVPASREPYRFPFATRDAWLAFVADTPGGSAAADAYRRLYSDTDYIRWATGVATTTERITYRSDGLVTYGALAKSRRIAAAVIEDGPTDLVHAARRAEFDRAVYPDVLPGGPVEREVIVANSARRSCGPSGCLPARRS